MRLFDRGATRLRRLLGIPDPATVLLLPPGALQTERLPDGRRRLLRDLVVSIDGGELVGRELRVPAGMTTDFSSWPRLLPGPAFHRIDVAGVLHDFLFQAATWGVGGESVGYVEANRVWYAVARAGEKKARAGRGWGWTGRIGLFLFSWPVWRKYRKAQREAVAEG